jgi:hypothetical protein
LSSRSLFFASFRRLRLVIEQENPVAVAAEVTVTTHHPNDVPGDVGVREGCLRDPEP